MGDSSAALHRLTLAEISDGLSAGDFSSRELTEALLDRIETHEATLNAFITAVSYTHLTLPTILLV